MGKLKILCINLNENDAIAIKENFNSTYLLSFVNNENYQEIIKRSNKGLPDIVIADIVNNPDNGMKIIRDIKAMSKEKSPFFVVALCTEETEINEDPYTKELKYLGIFFPNYGKGQNIEDIIKCINCMAGDIKAV